MCRGESADSCVGLDCHWGRFVCQFGRKSDRSGQHPGLGVLWQHPRSLSGGFLYSSSYRIGRVFRGALAQALVFVLFATTNIGYLWYNFIGCAAVLILAPVLQQTIFRGTEAPAAV